LVEQTASIADLVVHFEIDEYTKWRLLEGLDDIGLTLRDEQAITDFEAKRGAWMPKTLPARN
jgi:3-isopropylmalate/(R)-2-methylmalate dehydratase small subunit